MFGQLIGPSLGEDVSGCAAVFGSFAPSCSRFKGSRCSIGQRSISAMGHESKSVTWRNMSESLTIHSFTLIDTLYSNAPFPSTPSSASQKVGVGVPARSLSSVLSKPPETTKDVLLVVLHLHLFNYTLSARRRNTRADDSMIRPSCWGGPFLGCSAVFGSFAPKQLLHTGVCKTNLHFHLAFFCMCSPRSPYFKVAAKVPDSS